MKNFRFAGLMAAAFVAAPFAVHADNTIDFVGELTNVTCTLVTSTNGNLTVPLGKIPVSSFSGSAPVPAGNFSISVTGCGSTANSMTPFFANHGSVLSINNVTGNMRNTATASAASGVELQLVNATTTVGTVALNQGMGAQNVDAAPVTAGAATSSFSVRYVKTGTVTAGAFTSGLTYSLTYN